MIRSLRFAALLIVTACALLTWAMPAQCGIIYVKWDSPNNGPGTDWDHACHTVAAGLAAAVSGSEVWVAKGTYVERITLKDGVGLYGGFAGTETTRDERDWKANVTILDGNNKGGTVVTSPDGANSGTRIDGFTIRNGNSGSVAGLGGGIYGRQCAITIANNVITGNWASHGGGIDVSGSPVITDNLIVGNTASTYGGGIYAYGAVIVTNNLIAKNSTDGCGGAIYLSGPGPARIANNVVSGNGALDGGGIYTSGQPPVIVNNTITANCGSGICLAGSASSAAIIANTIVAFNSSGVLRSSGSVTLSHNCVYGNTSYGYSGVSDPTGADGNISADPRFASIEYGNWHIQQDSACVDAGDSTYASGEHDIDGGARLLPASGAVDIGADESDGTSWPAGPYVVTMVSPEGNDTSDGLSWETAKRTVQAGIDQASALGGEVWVKSGTYYERIAVRAFSYVYGGFSGSETVRSQRDYVANSTTLDGQRNGTVVRAYAGHKYSGIDGFTIQNGRAMDGGGVSLASTAFRASNNRIRANTATHYGGGICYSGSPELTGNFVSGNSAASGGGIYGTGPAIIANNSIVANSASVDGGGAYLSGAAAVANNAITANTAISNGGGLYISGAASLTSNTIAANGAAAAGGGIYMTGSSSVTAIANSIVAFNSSGIYRSSGSPVLSHNCVYGNTDYDYSGVASPTEADGNIAVDPVFASPQHGNWHIQPDSPCIDTGDERYRYGEADIDGQPRVQPVGGTIDIGADESDGTVWTAGSSAVIRVSTTGNDRDDGFSWAAAKRTVQAAIDAACLVGGEVWVKSGTYYERVTLRSSVSVYGGFTGAETERDQRDWKSNLTILDGQKAGSVITVLAAYDPGTIDGLTITNGIGSYKGGGLYCVCSSPSISNCTIKNNKGSNGGAIYCRGGAPSVSDCTISNNTADDLGGGGCFVGGTPSIIRSTISYNTSRYMIGGGIWCQDNPSATISDCIISYNSAPKYCAGGIELLQSPATITRCRIEYNTALLASAGIDTNGCSPTISNNLIRGNLVTKETTYAADGGAGLWTWGGSPIVTNNTFIDNRTGSKGGAIWVGNSTGRFANNVFAFNSSGVYGNAPYGAPVFANNCFFGNTGYDFSGLSAGATDIFANPLMTAWATGDCHPLPNSPCIDAGNPTGAPDVDLDGLSRPRDGNGDGTAIVDIGCYESPNNYASLAGAKALADGASVGIAWPITTALLDGRYYVESPDRAAGIGVLGSASGVGKRVAVEGTMTTIDGERLIQPSYVLQGSTAPIPLPWFVNANALGGGSLGLQTGVSDWRLVRHEDDQGKPYWLRELFTYGGANNIGLLVKMTGRVTQVGSGFFYLDGSVTFDDGDETVTGVRVEWPFAAALPPEGSFVEIVGVSSCRLSQGQVVRLLRPISADSVRSVENE